MRKSIKKIFRKKRKNNKKRTYKSFKKYKGGKIVIKSYEDLKARKDRLVQSFDYLNEIYDKWYDERHTLTIRGYVEAIVTGIYTYPTSYDTFNNFYNKLVEYKIIECDEEKHCINYTYAIPGTGRALYGIFKIYFVIAFIIGYVYTNPTKFISEDFLKSKLINFPFVNVIIYFLKNIGTSYACNNCNEQFEMCYLPRGLDKFILVNDLCTNENRDVTILIFEFVDLIRPYNNIDWLADPNLDPRKKWW